MPQVLGSLEEQVMLAVLRTGEAAYGMNVRRELESVTGREFAIGAIYATLDRLEAKKLVKSRRIAETADAPSRRIFGITNAGLRALDETRAQRDRLWDGVSIRSS